MTDNEFSERELDLDVSRWEFAYSEVEYDRMRNGDHDPDLYQDSRDRGRVRQKDMKERELMNFQLGQGSDSGSDGNSGGVAPTWCEFSVGSRDREAGELSSESGSDEGIDLESQGKDKETLKLENMTQLLGRKKRKFSPIMWDRNEVSNLCKSRVSSATNAFPPPPPLRKSYLQSANSILTCGVHVPPIKDSKLHNLEPLVDIVPLVSAAVEPPAGLSSYPLQEQHSEYNQDVDQLKDEVYAPMQNIRSSRWANDANFPADEGEFSDAPAERRIHKWRKKISLATPV